MSALRQMAQIAASRGRGGDRHLVHVNDRELDEMRDRWGDPTVNPDTGLPEFFLGGVLDAITSIIQPIAQIAGSVLPFFAPSGGVQQSTQQSTGYVPGQSRPPSNFASPSSTLAPASGSSGALSKLLGGGSFGNALPAALLSAMDYFSQPDVPSVADQLAEINAAQSASNPYWATPLPEVQYDRQSVSPPAGYDFGAGPEFSFFTNNQIPTVKKAFGGLAAPFVRAPSTTQAPPLANTYPARRLGMQPHVASSVDNMSRFSRMRPYGAPSLLLGTTPRPTLGYKKHGGEMRAAGRMYHGPGGGQGDKIPAMLSDGEYVIDATTVADLGDGDTDVGAAKLDQLRGAVARHKGRKNTVPPKAHGAIAKYLRAAA